MCETKRIVDAATGLRRANEPFLVATVMRLQGSSYRGPGARMLLARDRWLAGSLSGGCLEGDVVKKGWWRTREGQAVVVRYDATRDDDLGWGFGLGCDGVVDVLLERAGATGNVDALAFLETCWRSQRRGAIATVFRAEGGRARVGGRVAVRAGAHTEADIADGPMRALLERECREVLANGRTHAPPRRGRRSNRGARGGDRAPAAPLCLRSGARRGTAREDRGRGRLGVDRVRAARSPGHA